MTENTLANTNQTENEIVQVTDNYVIKKNPEGKFKKEIIYKAHFTKKPETDEEKIELYNVLNSQDEDNELVTPMARMVGEKIGIEHFYINPYESFNEETGETVQGVTTTIYDNGHYYVTSSKSVYHSLLNMVKVFGSPEDENYKKIIVKITGTKRQNGIQINLSLDSVEQ